MPKIPAISPESFTSFGTLLKFLRRRVQLTQNELALAVGYHYTQLSKLEHNQRLPDRATLQARFVPALMLEDEPIWAERLVALAEEGRAPADADAKAEVGGEPAPVAQAVAAAPAHVLPAPLTAFIGRQRVVAAILNQIQEPSIRLLTLLGPSGIGKTRLALQAAAKLETAFADGVVFVPLEDVRVPIQVPVAIAAALGIMETTGRTLHQSLLDAVRGKQLLLVLDNFEQVVDAAPFVTDLLAAAPRLKVLVTSREILDVYGEHRFVVPPLDLPDSNHLPDVKELAQVAAIALFCQRAQAVKPSFQLNVSNAPAVAEVCARLDGLPLAIELAAARINLFSPQAMVQQLNNRAQWLAGHNRNLPARQQTLLGAIAWSYDLLDPLEQQLFVLLAVFTGGFTLPAALAVARGNPAFAGADVAELVLLLVNQSLIWQTEDDTGETRFRMLETIHDYALQQLEAAPAIHELAINEHAAYFVDLAEQTADKLHGPSRVTQLEQLETEHGNFRAALRYLLLVSHTPTTSGPRLALALWNFWLMGGHLSEGRLWLEAAYSVASDEYRLTAARQLGEACWNLGEFTAAKSYLGQAVTWARNQPLSNTDALPQVLNVLGRLTKDMGQYAESKTYLEEGLSLAKQYGYDAAAINLLRNLGNVSVDLGQPDAAQTYFIESLGLARKYKDRAGIGGALNNLGIVALTLKDYVGADTYLRECLAIFEADRMHLGMTLVTVNLGRVAQLQGRMPEARALFEQSLMISRTINKKWSEAYALSNLGSLACALKQYAEAGQYFRDSLKTALEAGAAPRVLDALSGVAVLWTSQNQPQSAAALASLVASHTSSEREAIDRVEPLMTELQSRLSDDKWNAALESGRAMSYEAAARKVLEHGFTE